jgi:hypothetical protein
VLRPGRARALRHFTFQSEEEPQLKTVELSAVRHGVTPHAFRVKTRPGTGQFELLAGARTAVPMDPLEVASYATHSLFAGLWTGSVLFVTIAVLPLARDGDLNAAPLSAIGGTLATISRISAVVLLLTGGHMAGVRYTGETLTGSTGGYLVLAMVALWLGLIATVEVATSRLADGTDRDKVREPARRARPLLLAASLLAVGLLVDAGLISARNLGFL